MANAWYIPQDRFFCTTPFNSQFSNSPALLLRKTYLGPNWGLLANSSESCFQDLNPRSTKTKTTSISLCGVIIESGDSGNRVAASKPTNANGTASASDQGQRAVPMSSREYEGLSSIPRVLHTGRRTIWKCKLCWHCKRQPTFQTHLTTRCAGPLVVQADATVRACLWGT